MLCVRTRFVHVGVWVCAHVGGWVGGCACVHVGTCIHVCTCEQARVLVCKVGLEKASKLSVRVLFPGLYPSLAYSCEVRRPRN
jgi:hypothetical protein